MIIAEHAELIASQYLRDIDRGSDYTLQLVNVLERPRGWVLIYQSKDYLASGDLADLIAGNARFLIAIEDGSIHVFGTALPVADHIQEYERAHDEKR